MRWRNSWWGGGYRDNVYCKSIIWAHAYELICVGPSPYHPTQHVVVNNRPCSFVCMLLVAHLKMDVSIKSFLWKSHVLLDPTWDGFTLGFRSKASVGYGTYFWTQYWTQSFWFLKLDRVFSWIKTVKIWKESGATSKLQFLIHRTWPQV